MLTVIVFLITLSVLVLVHELGHFLAAKKSGIKVEEFGFGYPPRLWGKKIGETVYSINWIPFGGFVKLYGEELAEEKRGKDTFWSKSKKVRTAVIVAGVLGNFLLAIICFSIVYSAVGIPIKTDQVKIVGIAQDSPAEKMGLKKNDIILAVDDKDLHDLKHFIALIEEKKETQVKLLIKREENNLLLFIMPRESPPEGQGSLGVVVSSIEMKKYPFWQMPFRGAVEGIKEAMGWGTLIFSSLAKMVVDLVGRGVVPKDVAGPVGIFQVTAGVAQQGILTILQFIGVLSVNLAVLNILPFPALDGGRLLFILYEVVTRKRPKPSIEHWVNAVGMAVLLSLIILVTVNDIQRIIKTTSLAAQLRSFWPF
ncbi:MAG TPA: M50 family metallopeptidase [Nevskiaceae bacterium]|nr:M50 family metallopeptidase [Nevskiaceae bacterium]